MNKYSNKGPFPFEEARFRNSYTGLHFKENILKPVNLNCKSDQLTLSAHSGNSHPDNLTPRGKYGEKCTKMGELFAKSIRTTPTKERIRKDYSFVLVKGKEDAGNCKNDHSPTLTVSPKEVRNDRSQRVFPSRPLNNDASMRRIVEAPTLRQTVSNASAWQYRNLVPSATNISRK